MCVIVGSVKRVTVDDAMTMVSICQYISFQESKYRV